MTRLTKFVRVTFDNGDLTLCIYVHKYMGVCGYLSIHRCVYVCKCIYRFCFILNLLFYWSYISLSLSSITIIFLIYPLISLHNFSVLVKLCQNKHTFLTHKILSYNNYAYSYRYSKYDINTYIYILAIYPAVFLKIDF